MCCSTKDSEIDHFAEGMVRKKKEMKLLTQVVVLVKYLFPLVTWVKYPTLTHMN